MKKNLLPMASAAIFCVTVFTSPLAIAQMQSTTTTQTSSAGTISAYSPTEITVRSTSSPLPVRYSYSKTTTYVDENGNPVSVETVKSGAPVTVYYSQDGDRMVASKVVVRKSVSSDGTSSTTQTTTTSSDGTVQTFGGDTISVQGSESSAPVSYSSSRTTTYVDENGNAVSSETVKSGAPVTVYYTKDGDRMVASRVVVHNSSTTVQPDGSTIEHKKTTTTTTTEPNP